MALIAKGNLTFKLQTGAFGPSPDDTFGIYRRRETWQGKQSDLAAWLLTKPHASAHPTWPWLRLANLEPRYLEAGMVDVDINYAGHPNEETEVTSSKSMSSRAIEATGQLTRRARMFADLESSPFLDTGPFFADLVAEGSSSKSVYIPSVTYRYGSRIRLKEPLKKTLALLELVNSVTSDVNPSIQKTGRYYLAPGAYPAWVVSVVEQIFGGATDSQVKNPRLFWTSPAVFSSEATPLEENASNPEIISLTDLRCDPVGRSGWYDCEETWELIVK